MSGAPAVRVRVPATSANLGPAFDCAGLALTRYDEVEVSLLDRGHTEIVAHGEGADTLVCDETHLVARAFRAACAQLGWDAPGLRIEARNAIPQGRGMGSSAAAVVAGALAAWAMCPDVEVVDRDAVLRLTTAMEGHPDNVAACLLGGFTLSWTTDAGASADTLRVHDDVLPVVLVPGGTLSTPLARGLLPDAVPHADAAFTAGRAALLVHALTREPGLLGEATEDRLHQRQRAAAMPDSARLLGRLRAAGHAAVVSGAGPSLLVLTRRHPDDPPGDPDGAVRVREVVDLTPPGWIVLPLGVDPRGAQVTGPAERVSSR
ncbi:homoserine kinase [Geodermatophilus pulveris]|uniref:homoserine kinase n=1 Tax=Geodermatophilus pulveris TaxID=1564159 RepID=UPI001FE8C71E|nr:homoserine kinase [Geodermatophilus pulveris]